MKKPKYDWHSYPLPKRMRGGCKVSWNYYLSYENAEACSKAARHNAAIKESLGYDFGYCDPGSIRLCQEGVFAGMYEVCLP